VKLGWVLDCSEVLVARVWLSESCLKPANHIVLCFFTRCLHVARFEGLVRFGAQLPFVGVRGRDWEYHVEACSFS